MKRLGLLMAAPLLATLVSLAPAEAGERSELEAASQLIIVEPVPEQVSVQANLNRGGRNPRYRVGEPIQIQVRPSQDAFIYLFSIEADGQIQLILPNRFAPAPFLRANQTQTFPSSGSRFQYRVSAPYGQAQVLVVASKDRLSSQDLAFFRNGYGQAPQQTLQSQAIVSNRAIVVEPSEYPWVTRSLYYRVVN